MLLPPGVVVNHNNVAPVGNADAPQDVSEELGFKNRNFIAEEVDQPQTAISFIRKDEFVCKSKLDHKCLVTSRSSQENVVACGQNYDVE